MSERWYFHKKYRRERYEVRDDENGVILRRQAMLLLSTIPKLWVASCVWPIFYAKMSIRIYFSFSSPMAILSLKWVFRKATSSLIR